MNAQDLAITKEEISNLYQEIRHHDWCYYVANEPEISDQEYDCLMERLVALERNFPDLVTPDSPSQRVGGEPLSSFPVVEHTVLMLSLANTYSKEELLEFDQRVRKGSGIAEVDYVVELKVDGVAVSLHYEGGQLVRGSTRGDGLHGDEITANLKTIKSVPLNVFSPDAPFSLLPFEVRGEVFMTGENFERLNRVREKAGEPLFANPRNATAGSLKLLDPRLTAKRPLDIFLYTCLAPQGLPETQAETLTLLTKTGFKVNPPRKTCQGIQAVIKYCQEWENKREQLAYDIDGLVIKINSFALQKLLGETSKNPRWAISYKFPAKQATTRLKTIQLQVGRTGTITPVALLEPVALSGSMIGRATLHNADEIKRKDIRVGDRVIIEKGGEVIPKVVKVITSVRTGEERQFSMPSHCPSCGGTIFREEGESTYRCQNLDCPAQLERILQHFASRNAMDIEELGPALISKLIASGKVKNIANLYDLRLEDLISLDRMAEKSAANFLSALQKSKSRPLAALIFGLGIRHVGVVAAENLVRHFHSLDALQSAILEELQKVPGVGGVMAESIESFFRSEKTGKILKNLRQNGLTWREKNMVRKEPEKTLTGQRFIFTGTLAHSTRSKAEELVKRLGGIIGTTVGKSIDFVVTGKDPGSKYQKARNLGLKILTEEDFQKMIV